MVYADLKNKLDEYNWDDGFEIPRTILADPDCDLALALEIFYLAGGYEYLEKSARRTKLQKWNPFITVLGRDIYYMFHLTYSAHNADGFPRYVEFTDLFAVKEFIERSYIEDCM